MTKTIRLPHNLYLVLRPSRWLTRIVIACALVLSVAVLLALGSWNRAAQQQTEALKAKAALLEQENQKLSESIDRLGSVASMEEIAQDELGLADPDTIIFQPAG